MWTLIHLLSSTSQGTAFLRSLKVYHQLTFQKKNVETVNLESDVIHSREPIPHTQDTSVLSGEFDVSTNSVELCSKDVLHC